MLSLNIPRAESGTDGNLILLADGSAKDVDTALRSFSAQGLANQVQVVSDGPEALDFLRFRMESGRRPRECATPYSA